MDLGDRSLKFSLTLDLGDRSLKLGLGPWIWGSILEIYRGFGGSILEIRLGAMDLVDRSLKFTLTLDLGDRSLKLGLAMDLRDRSLKFTLTLDLGDRSFKTSFKPRIIRP